VRLARIGFDTVLGVVTEPEDVLIAHPEVAQTASRLAAVDLARWRDDESALQIIDVRNPGEKESGIVHGARLMPLPTLLDGIRELDPARPTVVYCAGGYRSSVAASLLRANGFSRVADIVGGIDAWRASGLPVEVPPAVEPESVRT
jgi:hydroxyacylglutathione hydrolase